MGEKKGRGKKGKDFDLGIKRKRTDVRKMPVLAAYRGKT